MTETVQRGARDPSLDVKMTDYAAILTFASYGCDASLLGTSMSVESDDASPGAGHLLVQLITRTAAAAEQLAVQHRLTEDPDRAARLRVGTKLWSGWLTSESSSLPVRCVLYAQAQA
jgi:hypothetical protein